MLRTRLAYGLVCTCLALYDLDDQARTGRHFYEEGRDSFGQSLAMLFLAHGHVTVHLFESNVLS